ncbi:hypothetical protein H7I01_09555 [Mycobacterium palustre]|nr:hypothetical protein [Mycobacterium palustre]
MIAAPAAPVAAPAAPAPASPAATVTAPQPVSGAEGFGYLVGPGPDLGPSVYAGATLAAPAREASEATAPAVAAGREEGRQHRRRSAVIDRGYRYEYLDADADDGACAPEPYGRAASQRGAGALGFAGTLPAAGLRPAGLTTMPGDAFGAGPRMPMVPRGRDTASDA